MMRIHSNPQNKISYICGIFTHLKYRLKQKTKKTAPTQTYEPQ